MRRLASVVVWSVLAAAFIGPGTVTTAASAGAGFGYALLWTLVFSTLACVVLQEAAARLTIGSGLNLAEALRERYPAGLGRLLASGLVLGAIVLGCAAYEAGNILGAVAGGELLVDLPATAWTLILGALAGLLLWFQSPHGVARALAILVAAMGIAFLCTAWLLRPDLAVLWRGAWRPEIPPGATVLALGLVGTTVVPYNLFLGSGLARGGGRLAETRFGIVVAVGLGGAISMGVLVVGAALRGPFEYAALAAVLAERLGAWAGDLVGVGLLAAGLSSAVTAPLAAALTARGLAHGGAGPAWDHTGWRYRGVWLAVLLVGVGFGVAGAPPIPVIVLAQAFNGVLLPLVAVFLFLAVNDRRQMGSRAVNGAFANLLTFLVVGVAVVLGLNGLAKAGSRALGVTPPSEAALLAGAAILLLLLAVPLTVAVRRARRP